MVCPDDGVSASPQADTIGDSSANVAATCVHVGNLPEPLEDEEKLRTVFEGFGVVVGLGRIVALYDGSSTLYHIREHIRCICF